MQEAKPKDNIYGLLLVKLNLTTTAHLNKMKLVLGIAPLFKSKQKGLRTWNLELSTNFI